MCWVSRNRPVEHIAREDVPVFKVALYNKTFKRILSLFQYFEYEKDKLYNLSKGLEVLLYTVLGSGTDEYRIYKGFHSYSCQNKIMKMPLGYLISYNGRENSWIGKEKSQIVKLNCIIPKGSRYYINEIGECVSDQIKIINVEDICAG